MGFFGRAGGEDAEQDESRARIEAGGIPLDAEARLKSLAIDGSLFTSGLSVNEFALLGRLGPRPLAQVMGASVVRVGWQYLPALDPGVLVISAPMAYGSGPSVSGMALANPFTEPSMAQKRAYTWHTEVVCVLDVLTDAWNTARRRALNRLREEASHVGADAVVDVHLRHTDHDLGKGTIEYVVTGTAIRHPDSTGSPSPRLTDVSVQDYWRLHTAGDEPVELVAATAVVFASPARSTRMRRVRTKPQNQELGELSRGFHTARETVRSRLKGQGADAKAAGVVGVTFSHSVHRETFSLGSTLQTSDRRGWHRGRFGLPYRVSGRGEVDRRGWVITMHAAGTAIRSRDSPSPPEIKTSLRMGRQ